MKNNNIFLWVLVFILIFAGVAWFGRPSGKPAPANVASVSRGVLQAEHAMFDFGAISMAAGKVSHRFKIKNESAEAVTVTKMYTSCMCTTASLFLAGKQTGPVGMQGMGYVPDIAETIVSGKEAEVEAVFDPAAHGPAGVGQIDRAVTLENNSGKPIELHFSAYVTP